MRAFKPSPSRARKAVNSQLRCENTGSIHFVPFDLAEIEGIADLVKRLRKDFGPIYGLVNNAGHECGRGSRLDAELANGAGGALEYAFAHGDDEIRGALHDGRWGRPHRQHGFDHRIHWLQWTFSLQRHESLPPGFHPIAGQGSGTHGSERKCRCPRLCRYGHDPHAQRRAPRTESCAAARCGAWSTSKTWPMRLNSC